MGEDTTGCSPMVCSPILEKCSLAHSHLAKYDLSPPPPQRSVAVGLDSGQWDGMICATSGLGP